MAKAKQNNNKNNNINKDIKQMAKAKEQAKEQAKEEQLNFAQLLEQAKNTTVIRNRTGIVKETLNKQLCYIHINANGTATVYGAVYMQNKLLNAFKLKAVNTRQQLNKAYTAMLARTNRQQLEQQAKIILNS